MQIFDSFRLFETDRNDFSLNETYRNYFSLKRNESKIFAPKTKRNDNRNGVFVSLFIWTKLKNMSEMKYDLLSQIVQFTVQFHFHCLFPFYSRGLCEPHCEMSVLAMT